MKSADPQLSNRTRLLALMVLLTAGLAAAQGKAQESMFDVGCAAQASLQVDGSLRLVGAAELGSETEGWQLSAEEVLIDPTMRRITATGSIVFVTAEVRITAERVELNVGDRSAVFHDAQGTVVKTWRGSVR